MMNKRNQYKFFLLSIKSRIGIFLLFFFFYPLLAEERPFVFPKDHSFHSRYKVEWCYFVGVLKSVEGKEYGYELSFFKGTFGKNKEVFPVHFAISDFENRNHKIAQTIERKLGGMAGYDSEKIFSGNYSMKILGKTEFHLLARDPENSSLSLDLKLTAKPSDILLHGDKGKSIKSRKNPNFYSYYYSIPGLFTKGELRIGEKKIQIVSGDSWMDHEWSSPFDSSENAELSNQSNSWDWICIQLEDGTKIMAFNFRESPNSRSESFASVRLNSGKKIGLEREGEVLFSHDSSKWKSKTTQKEYPLRWNLITASSEKEAILDLKIEPVFEDQEFDSRPTTGFSYWEGAVRISGTRDGKKVKGTGYLELKGNQN
ncbi:lipocalin-like domain-containing protein [Leptospira stimsonii]|uniref:Carotenoid 1,2-hydratase n=1 Tax=Leptospira stimsonii TaxID=2202203 RepID=A0A4R9L964_9LEPT|nr:lipocalin-like domain-containing protein [Leptospira stimsonii]RHX88939.1 carotenoid 1,2-hydratase [Leptospira stimsonii]TGK11347.1 carotenoid 1,2-hydratase [Leptospira stimsonii]TGM19307.1 carotenoid 1,2-hydratase [Leptospira stimsonii]